MDDICSFFFGKDIYAYSSSVRFRTSPTNVTTSHKPVEQPSTSSGEESLLSRRKRIEPTEITPRSKLPDSVRRRVKSLLSTQLNNVKVPEKKSIRLQCNTQLARSIRAGYPDTEFIWSHNRQWLHPDGVKYVLTNGDLLVNDTNQVIDQGVYVCQLLSRGKWRVTMAIYALAVSPSATVYRVFAGSKLEMFCDSQTLGRIYRGSTRTWSLNGSAVENLTGIDARVDSADRVYNVQQNHSGVWACLVIRAENPNKYWQTNQIVVEVCPKPSWWRSMVYRFPLPIVAESFGFTLFLFSLFLCAIATMKRVKQQSSAYGSA